MSRSLALVDRLDKPKTKFSKRVRNTSSRNRDELASVTGNDYFGIYISQGRKKRLLTSLLRISVIENDSHPT